MPDKQKNAKKSRTSKTSAHSGVGSKPIRLTELQKILICNGGMAHSYLRGNAKRQLGGVPKRFPKEDRV
jgi:hypothetical protein